MSASVRNDFPAPLIFMALLAMTSAAGFFADLSPKLMALFGVCWGVYGVVRALWLIETTFLLKDADHKQRSMILPWVILSGMGLRSRMDTGFRAMDCVDRVLIVTLVLGLIYCAWCVFVMTVPSLPDGLQLAVARSRTFFVYDLELRPGHFLDPGYSHMLFQFSQFGMIGGSLYLARSYTMSMQKSRSFLVLCSCLFAIFVLLNLAVGHLAEGPMFLQSQWRGMGIGVLDTVLRMRLLDHYAYSSFFIRSAEIGGGGILFLGMAIFLIGLTLIKNSFQKPPKRYYAFGALAVIAIIVCFDLFWAHRPGLFGVYLSGWALVGVLWQLSISVKIRRTSMHQV